MDFSGLIPVGTQELLRVLDKELDLNGISNTSDPSLYDALIAKSATKFIYDYEEISLDSRGVILDLLISA
jgi:hypothetical protein